MFRRGRAARWSIWMPGMKHRRSTVGQPSDTLLQKAMNAIYDDNGRGYDWLPSQLKCLYIQHVFSGPMFRHHNCIHRQEIEPYLLTSTASTRRQHAIHGSTLYDSAEEGVSTASTRRQHDIHGARYTTRCFKKL